MKLLFLSGLDDADVTSILSVATHRRFSAPSVIVHQGDPAERFFLLTSGYGSQFVTMTDGRRVPLHWIKAGQIFGGAAILHTPSQYLASTEVSSDACALVWDRKTIRELASRWPQLLDNVFSMSVTEYIAQLVAAQVSLTCNDAKGRMAHLLLTLASEIGIVSDHGIELPIKNEDLATGANVTEFTASRILGRWQRAGILTKSRGKVMLQKPELLMLSS